MKYAQFFLISVLISGCAQFSTVQTDTSISPDKTQRTITTKAKASTLFASKSALANWKATQTDKTQGASVGTLQQESTDSVLLEALRVLSTMLK